MKLFNINGNIGKESEEFAGLFLLNENLNEIEIIYYIDDDCNEDKYLFRDLSFMKDLGKKIFDAIKKYDIEDVEIIDNVTIKSEYFQDGFKDEIKKVIEKIL